MSAPGSSEPVPQAGPEWATSCLNCGTPLGGVYCPSCGQQASDPNPTMRDLAAEFFGELTSFDGKLWRTLRTLFLHPGELTVAFFAGRRVSYLSPVKLYLTCSLLGFLSGPMVDTVRERLGIAPDVTTVKGKRGGKGSGVHISAPDSSALDSLLKDSTASLAEKLAVRAARNGTDPGKEARFADQFTENLPRLVFVLLPVFATLLALLNRGRGYRFPRHLYVAIHLHAAFFLALALQIVLGQLPVVGGWMPMVCLAYLAWYATATMQRVYGGSRRRAIAITSVALSTYLLIVAAALIGLVVVVALLLP